MGAERNFIYIRPACLLYDTELLTQTSSQAHPATNHCVQQAVHQRLFRPVCEAGQSQWCNNATGNVVLVHAFSIAGGSRSTVPVIHSLVTTCNCIHIYCPADLHGSTEPPVHTEQAAGCAPKPRFTFWIKKQNLYCPENRNTNYRLNKPLPCHYTEWYIAVATRKTNGTSRVDLCDGSYS